MGIFLTYNLVYFSIHTEALGVTGMVCVQFALYYDASDMGSLSVSAYSTLSATFGVQSYTPNPTGAVWVSRSFSMLLPDVDYAVSMLHTVLRLFSAISKL